MKVSSIVLIIAGVIILVSLFLTWGSFLGLDKVSYNAWDMDKFFSDGDGIVNLLASFSNIFILVFGFCMIPETIANEYRPEFFNNKYGFTAIFSGIVPLFFSVVAIVAINDLYLFEIGYGAYIAIIGSILAIVGGVMSLKGI